MIQAICIRRGKTYQLEYFNRLNAAILFHCVFSHAHYIELDDIKNL